MKTMTLAAAAIAALTSLSSVLAQDFDEVEIESTDLGGGIHMLTGYGGNIGLLVGDDGVFMVDDQFAELSDKIASKVDEIAGQGAADNVQFLVNTHYHFDHAGGNVDWHERGSTIVAHDNVRTRLASPSPHPLTGEMEDAKPEEAWPVITYPDAMTFHVNGQTIRLRHVPNAHTDGDTIVYFQEANIVHMGDVMFNGAFPFIDIIGGGSIDGFIAAQELAVSYIDDDTQVIPGHGPMATKADMIAYIDMLKGARETIVAHLDEGKSVDEIVEANPLADLDADWGQGFMKTDVFTNIVATSLSAAE